MSKIKFRKKPVVIEAIQFQGMDSYLEVCDLAKAKGTDIYDVLEFITGGMYIKTLEGKMRANPGDWIIFGVNNEIYPCKPDIFEKTYERAE